MSRIDRLVRPAIVIVALSNAPRNKSRGVVDGSVTDSTTDAEADPGESGRSSAAPTRGDRPSDATRSIDRRRAAIAAIPLLAVGVGNLVVILLWGVDPLWGFVVLLPIVFVTAIAWFAFRVRPSPGDRRG